jgi:hypothetical protein
MNWTKKDKNLFTIINQSGDYHLEKQIQDASNMYFTLTKIPDFYSIFGYYNINNNTFYWENKINEYAYSIIKSKYMKLFGSDSTIKKLCRPSVRFDNEFMNVIPYLMEALNNKLNVVRVKCCNGYIYALTNVEGITKTFNSDIFEDALVYYRKEDEIDRSKLRNSKIKKGKKCVFECKEKLV